ncbi:DMT family transporter [Azospirillum canadense]|uniref:DMT family transporter n=1 Tax=Azospirillum canadense TaxID=403962 RepID=UPI0022265FDA|nr:DMT family transporter [Azospirillum canadense]MCW2243495.1 drug/metabolite transporter (DMT)-like permease [Azospirillum canadense]
MPKASPNAAIAAYSFYFLSSAFFASNIVFGRAAAHVVPPAGLAFWRWVIAFLIILPFAARGLLTHRHALFASWKRLLVMGVLGQVICGAGLYVALEYTSATNAGLIYATSPVMILLITALWLGEAVTLRQSTGILLAMAGVLVILTRGDPEVLLHLSFNIGDLMMVGVAAAWAVYTVLARQSKSSLPVVTSFAANAFAGIVALAPFCLWETVALHPAPMTLDTVARIAGLALFASVLAFITYQKTILLMGPARGGTSLYVMPLWTALAAWALLGEELHLFHLAGVALVLPGLLLATLPPRSGSRAAQPEKSAPITRSSAA